MAPEREPCPDCGETKTLELLRYETYRLKQLVEEKKYDPPLVHATPPPKSSTPHNIGSGSSFKINSGAGTGSGASSKTVIIGSNANVSTAGVGILGSSGMSNHATAIGQGATAPPGSGSVALGAGPSSPLQIGGSWNQARMNHPLLEIPYPVNDSSKKEPPHDEYRVELAGRLNGMECCLGCNRYYNPYLKHEIAQIEEEIENLRCEAYSPLELLADAANPPEESAL